MRRFMVICLFSLLAAVMGCGGDRVDAPNRMAADSIGAAPDTASTATSNGDPTATAVDSMRVELAKLTASVNALRRAGGITTPLLETAAAAEPEPTLDPRARVREAATDVRHFGLRSIWALIIVAVTWLMIRGTAWLLHALAERSPAQRLFFKRLIPIVRLVIWAIVAFYIVAGVFNVDRAGLFAATAALGVGVGFAAQGVLKNLIGGLIIIFDQPFQTGDKIRVGGTYGEVVSIGMRSTRIVTPDDNLVSVPNGQVVEEQVANANAGALDCQVVVDLYLPGWIDVAAAKKIAYDAAVNSKYAYLKKPVVVNVRDEFKETFLTHLMVKVYVLDTRYEFALASDVTEAAKVEFLKRGMLGSWADTRSVVNLRRGDRMAGGGEEQP